MNRKIIIFDDDENIRNDLRKHIIKAGYEDCWVMHSVEAGNEMIDNNKIDFAIVDLKFSGKELEGVKIIQNLNEKQPNAKIIIFSGYIDTLYEKKELLSQIKCDYFVSKGSEENVFKEVLSKIKEAEKKKNCFVIMPFSNTEKCTKREWTHIFNNVIKKSVEKSGYPYKCKRTELNIGNITENIIDNLYEADIVIADLTDKNPNVFYELGVRHALRDSTILISQSRDDVPFDLRNLACIYYNWKLDEDKQLFNRNIKNAIKDIEQDRKNKQSPIRKHLGLEE